MEPSHDHYQRRYHPVGYSLLWTELCSSWVVSALLSLEHELTSLDLQRASDSIRSQKWLAALLTLREGSWPACERSLTRSF